MQACPFGLDHRNLCMGREIDKRISGDTFGRAASQVDCCLLFLNIFSSSKVLASSITAKEGKEGCQNQ